MAAAAASAAASAATKQKLKYLLGKCMPSPKSNAARVQIPSYEYDAHLHMHFRKLEYLFAHDPDKICKTGDMVLVQDLPRPLTKHITHKVVEVVFPLGNITDPITNKKITASKYREDIKEVNELFGKSENGFDYEKAPPRGKLEGIRDFTDKPVTRKFHEDPNDPQPYTY